MKVLFALYDKDDRFVTCGFSLAEVGVLCGSSCNMQRNKGNKKLYRIPLEPQDDIFNEEDRIFIEEQGEKVFTNQELAELLKVDIRTIYRRKASGRNLFTGARQ